MGLNRKHLLHGLGSVLAVLGGVFVVQRLYQYSARADFLALGWKVWLATGCLSLLYGFAGFALAFAWRCILAWRRVMVAPAWAIRTYGISQIAKYTPGNIFHLAGRQGLGMAANLPAWPLAKSMVWEHGLLVLAAVSCAWLVLPSVMAPGYGAAWAFGGFAVCIVAVYTGLRWFCGENLAHAFLWHLGFMLISGLIFVVVLTLVASHGVVVWSVCLGAYVIAWLVGMVTPGAPAGMGIRETVLLALLPEAVIPKNELLLAIVLGRVVTVLGDVCFYAAAHLLREKSNRA